MNDIFINTETQVIKPLSDWMKEVEKLDAESPPWTKWPAREHSRYLDRVLKPYEGE